MRPRGRSFATGPRGCCLSAMRSISRTPPCHYYTAPKTLGGKTSWSLSLGPCWMAGVVEVPLKYAREVLDGKWGLDWALGYALTVHSSQGLTIAYPQKFWIIEDFLQWSNLSYLAVSRVEYMHQLERVVCPPGEGSEGARTLTEQQLRKVIQRKLVAYKRQVQAKGLRFSLKVDHILALKEAQNNHCAACNIKLLWAFRPKDTQQFSVDRLDNSMGHIHDNVRLTCLECNRKREAAALSA